MRDSHTHKRFPARRRSVRGTSAVPLGRRGWSGDKVSDVVVGKHFGCWTVWIADAKRAKRFEADAKRARPDFTCKDLRAAADLILPTDTTKLVYRAREL